MKKKLFLFLSVGLFIILLIPQTYSQVGIGNTNPNSDALLEVGTSSSTAGLLIPRVALTTGTLSSAPLSNDVAGMIIYNTATVGDVTPGFYYNDGSDWVRLGAGSSGNDWSLTGNSGTTPGTNYVGTSDSQNLIFATNGSENMRIITDGRVSINNNSPLAVDLFTATAASDDYAVNGYSSGTGAGVYGEHTGTGLGVWGNGATIGVFGTTATGAGLQGQASGAGIGAFGYANNATGFGMYARNENATGVGLVASGAGAGLTYLPATGATFNGSTAAAGFGSNTGLSGIGNGGITSTTLITGSGLAGTGSRTGVFGIATTAPSGNGNYSSGGYFTHGTGWAAVGGYQSQNGPPGTGTAFKIIGIGTVSTIVKGLNNEDLVMACPETPEVLFQDYGIGTLVNGYAKITIDPILSKNILVNNEHPLKVFIQLEGDCNGVFVTNKSANSFEVKELQNGTGNVNFSWSIVATRATEELEYFDGSGRTSLISDYSWRFKTAPRPLELNFLKTKVNETNYVGFANNIKKDSKK